MRGDALKEKTTQNTLAPSGLVNDAMAAEPVQQSGVGGKGNADDGGGGGEGANPAVAVQPGRCGKNEEAEDGLFLDTATLSAMERQINCNTTFHGFKNLDTKISVCQVCKHRLVQFAAPIH